MFDRLFAKTVFYPTLLWNLLLAKVLKTRNWWDEVEPGVIVGAYPFPSFVPAMHEAGVRAVVNTCEEYEGPQDQYEKFGIEQLRIPTIDFTHPLLEDVERAVEFTQTQVEQGKTVYIHCKAGRARSATVAICWLIKYRSLSMQEAQDQLLKHRAHINPKLTERPVVKEFFSKYSSPTA